MTMQPNVISMLLTVLILLFSASNSTSAIPASSADNLLMNTPLAKLTALTDLVLGNNPISDFSALDGLIQNGCSIKK